MIQIQIRVDWARRRFSEITMIGIDPRTNNPSAYILASNIDSVLTPLVVTDYFENTDDEALRQPKVDHRPCS